ncbi:MAG: hypothetical protein FWH36_00020 [Lentimicrobiaceae bacterium]|nr:hypothetical protein [Lentimicrobiaceae bacterium]
MKKQILATAILVLFVSCTVTKQKKLDNQSYQQGNENDNVTQAEMYKENETEKNDVLTTNSQVDRKAIFEKFRSEILPENRDDYNPHRYYAREYYLLTSLDMWAQNEETANTDCNRVQRIIEGFLEAEKEGNDGKRDFALGYFASVSSLCQEKYEFYKEQIKNNPSEAIRCQFITMLAGGLLPDNLSFILEYAQRDSLSLREKFAVASALTTYGVFTSNLELKEKAIKLLDEICYDFSSEDVDVDVTQNCIDKYYILGGEPSINFINAWREGLNEYRKILASVILAELGEYETTFPIFEREIHSEIINHVLAALDGLKVIATEEAFRLIEEQTRNKNEKIAKEAQKIYKSYYKESEMKESAVSSINVAVQKESNYNPYKYGREEYNRIKFDLIQNYGTDKDCEMAKKLVNRYYEKLEYMLKTKEDVGLFLILKRISLFQCEESYDFFKNMVKTDTSEENRCYAIMVLGWMRNVEFIGFLKEHLKEEGLSSKEKFAIANALHNIGRYNDRQDIIDEAVKILNELCYDENLGVVHSCIWEYYSMGGQPALDFFYYYLEKDNSRLSAAQRLAELGGLKEYEITFPIFVEALRSGDENDIHIAIFGLAAIGTEEAFELIREQTKSENEFIARRAQFIFDNIDKKRREKCEE